MAPAVLNMLVPRLRHSALLRNIQPRPSVPQLGGVSASRGTHTTTVGTSTMKNTNTKATDAGASQSTRVKDTHGMLEKGSNCCNFMVSVKSVLLVVPEDKSPEIWSGPSGLSRLRRVVPQEHRKIMGTTVQYPEIDPKRTSKVVFWASVKVV